MENNQHIQRFSRAVLRWLRKHMELLFWLLALSALYLMPADLEAISLCPVSWLGLGHCPGCGIGHAIRDALHFEWGSSFQHHIMGIPAVIIIFNRIIRLLQLPNTAYETKPRQPDSRY